MLSIYVLVTSMGARFDFRKASPTDSTALMGLIENFYAHEQIPFDRYEVDNTIELLLKNPSYGEIHIIFTQEKAIGYFILTFGFSLEFKGRDAFVDELFLCEGFRRQGIGTRALQYAEEICRSHGIQALHLEVDRQNVDAQAVYRKAGFTDHDRYLLTKKL